jgi:cell division protein FtsW (lipid II flippase)
MGFVFKSLCVWLLLMMFTIFLALRLDEKVLWNWFIIFIPLWLLDGVLFVYVIINAVKRWRSLGNSCGVSFVCYMASSVAFLLFQLLLCLRLEQVVVMSAYIPAVLGWITLTLVTSDCLYHLYKSTRR